MKDKILHFIRAHSLLCGGETVICAVSGGADSMAMLAALLQLREALGITLEAAHFNHCLRGEESDADEAFVREFCASRGVPLTCAKETLPDTSEETARDARYRFFASLGGIVATAHTADDNAETVLMNLLRGSGARGLSGIPPQRGNLIRPMLPVTRTEVLAFLRESGISWRTDSSNETDAYRRNRLRHQVIPLLQEENPHFSETVLSASLLLREEDAYLDALAAEALMQAQTGDGWRCEALRALPAALQRRALRQIAPQSGAPHIEALRGLLDAGTPTQLSLPGGMTANAAYGMLHIAAPQPPAAPIDAAVLRPGEAVRFGDMTLRAFLTDEPSAFSQSSDTMILNYDRLSMPLTVRTRAEGDRIRTRSGHRTLKRFMIDKKIPAQQRGRLPVICTGTQIAAVGGIGVDRDFLPAEGCRTLVIQSEYPTANKEE